MDNCWDTILRALQHRCRREIILALFRRNLTREGLNAVEFVSGLEQCDCGQIELVHNHLPKLAEMGFIRWNEDTNHIQRGPRWSDVRPVVQLIDAHQQALPDGWSERDSNTLNQ